MTKAPTGSESPARPREAAHGRPAPVSERARLALPGGSASVGQRDRAAPTGGWAVRPLVGPLAGFERVVWGSRPGPFHEVVKVVRPPRPAARLRRTNSCVAATADQTFRPNTKL